MKKPNDKRSYKELKQALDEVLQKLQHEDTEVDEAVKLHAEGQEILKQLDEYLQHIAENTEVNIKKIG